MVACLLDMWAFKSAWDPVYFCAEDFRRFDEKEIPLVFDDDDRKEWQELYMPYDAADLIAAAQYPEDP